MGTVLGGVTGMNKLFQLAANKALNAVADGREDLRRIQHTIETTDQSGQKGVHSETFACIEDHIILAESNLNEAAEWLAAMVGP